MIVHIAKEESYDFHLVAINENSDSYERGLSVEIPDALFARYKKALDELCDVQELLGEIHDRQGW